eukprot:TRINITY_DN1762_c0_g1_i4.p1 TRINITY_DN1762_c0_g1~~TRINITY_DN1762_c0_g1_i4.p1  ORF type:complete len:451 (-),score=64.79 TRINITY_DN1762_c0_g1_i4:231-1583(-)
MILSENYENIPEMYGIPMAQQDAVSPLDLECMICMDLVPSNKAYALSNCQHFYCNTCWGFYLKGKLEEGPRSILTTCPNPKCNSLCLIDTFEKFVSRELFARYLKFSYEYYIDENSYTKWCPAPNCDGCIRANKNDILTPVECLCEFRFCFVCNDYEIGDHAPAGCDDMELWLQKESDESENLTWMQANTKRCPKCKSHIEKNGGCMHMTCRKCRHEFCWLCFGNWKGHSACNKSETVLLEEKQAKEAANELEHYMFYYHRYESHKKAMKLASEQHRRSEERQHRLMTLFGVRSQDLNFLKDASKQLVLNRNMLSSSYVYGFYLSEKRVRSQEKALFEYLQECLEQHTDRLHENYEFPIEESSYENYIEWKGNVTNLTRVSATFLQNFIEGVIANNLVVPDGKYMTEEERFYSEQLHTLEEMGFDRSLTLPMLEQYDGSVESVVTILLGQ